MADLNDLFEQSPREAVRFLRVLLEMGAGCAALSTFPVVDSIQYSYTDAFVQTPAVVRLRVWLIGLLVLQTLQLPMRVLMLRTVHLVSLLHQREAIVAHLQGLVHTKAWRWNKGIGYCVYGWFLVGVYLSWVYGNDTSPPESLKVAVLCCALCVVLRMVFCFAAFFYLFMYMDEIPGVPNPRGATDQMMSRIIRFKFSSRQAADSGKPAAAATAGGGNDDWTPSQSQPSSGASPTAGVGAGAGSGGGGSDDDDDGAAVCNKPAGLPRIRTPSAGRAAPPTVEAEAEAGAGAEEDALLTPRSVGVTPSAAPTLSSAGIRRRWAAPRRRRLFVRGTLLQVDTGTAPVTPICTPLCTPIVSPCVSTHTTPATSPATSPSHVPRRLGGLQSAPPSPRGRGRSLFDMPAHNRRRRRALRRQVDPELLAAAVAALAESRRRNPMSPQAAAGGAHSRAAPAAAATTAPGGGKAASEPAGASVSDSDDDGEPCPICLSNFEEGDDMAQLPCHASHIFHYECVKLWFKQATSCPMCAGDLGEVDAEEEDALVLEDLPLVHFADGTQ